MLNISRTGRILRLLAGGVFGMALLSTATPAGASAADEWARRYALASATEREGFDAQDLGAEGAIERFTRAATLFESLAESGGNAPRAYWRAARARWMSGEALPLDEEERKIVAFLAAEALADKGLALDPDCAECMLWKFIAMGRLRTTRGAWEGIRQVKQMAELLDRGIALEPTYRDSDDNSTLGNLHYSSAIFYRLVPDWLWLKWVMGVRGDKQRALEHSRQALALHPRRLDYLIEVGTQLLCIGSVEDDEARLAEGLELMRTAVARRAESLDDAREIYFARIMIQQPDQACGYTGDKIMDVDEARAKAKAK